MNSFWDGFEKYAGIGNIFGSIKKRIMSYQASSRTKKLVGKSNLGMIVSKYLKSKYPLPYAASYTSPMGRQDWHNIVAKMTKDIAEARPGGNA